MMQEIFGYILASLIGISLGLIGAGGSIFAMPILVYLFHIKPALATTYSLFIVGITALIAVYRHHKMGNLHFQTALFFSIPSVISLLLIRKLLLPIIPQELMSFGDFTLSKNMLIMLVFAFLMILASVSMIKPSLSLETIENTSIKKTISHTRLVFFGFLIGCITGFLGAGGGFLMIPTLIFFADLSMKKAVGTSLIIIAFNSLIGFGADITDAFTRTHIDVIFLSKIISIAILGMFLGTYLSKKIDGDKLKPIFGWFILVTSAYIVVKELFLS
jgi:uncharacterized protein